MGFATLIRGNTTNLFVVDTCPNGIAYDPEGNLIKLWPFVYEIRHISA